MTLNLGAALAEAGKRVVLLDLDPQRDLSAYAKGVPGVTFEEARPENLSELLQHEADFFLLDCPPARGAHSAAALKVADVALVPLQTESLALLCSAPPEGCARWSLRLLRERLIEMEIVDNAGQETIRWTLKKTRSNRG